MHKLLTFNLLLHLGCLQSHRHDCGAATGVCVIGGINIIHFFDFKVEVHFPAPRHLDDAGRLLGTLDLLHQVQEGDAGGFAIQERIGGHHVLQEFQSLLIFRQLHERRHHRQRAPGLGLLLFEGLKGANHQRQLLDSRKGVAADELLILLAHPQRGRHKRGVLRHHRHAALKHIRPMRHPLRDGAQSHHHGGPDHRSESPHTNPHQRCAEPPADGRTASCEHAGHQDFLSMRLHAGGRQRRPRPR